MLLLHQTQQPIRRLTGLQSISHPHPHPYPHPLLHPLSSQITKVSLLTQSQTTSQMQTPLLIDRDYSVALKDLSFSDRLLSLFFSGVSPS